jgi:hypothetical protein
MASESRLARIEDAIAALAKARNLELLGGRESKYQGYLKVAEKAIEQARR